VNESRFTHPLTLDQVRQIETLAGETAADVRHVPVQFDHDQPFGPQAAALTDACDLSPEDWQALSLLVVPPSLNFSAVALLAELHGRCGYFSSCLRMRPAAGARPPRYKVAGVLDLQAVRDAARKKRG
jgi:hypothetical protein